jgi:hypothetical protein
MAAHRRFHTTMPSEESLMPANRGDEKEGLDKQGMLREVGVGPVKICFAGHRSNNPSDGHFAVFGHLYFYENAF